MRIVNIIAFTLLAITGILIYLIYVEGEEKYTLWLIPPVIGLAILYVSQSQIKWFLAKKNPPALDEKDLQIIRTHCPFYLTLDAEGKKIFEDRLTLVIMTRAFHMQHSKVDNLPYDMQILICLPLVQLAFYDAYYLEDHYQHIVLYSHPFITPRQNDKVQVEEIDPDDGVIIFSIEQLIPGFRRQSINIAAYTWAKAYYHHTSQSYTINTDKIAALHQAVLHKDINQTVHILNTKELNFAALLFALYYEFPKETKDHLPIEIDQQISRS